MNFKNFLAEKALNSKVFASTIERLSSSAKMGFELEMWVPEESDLLIISHEDSYKGDFVATANEAKKSLEDLLGYSVRVNGESINQWRIVPDGSIQEGGIGCGIEIVSPPDPIEDSLGDLKLMFKWMAQHDVITNSTTGLHINLSIPGLKEKLDPLKLILFMGESHVLGQYDRKFNNYAQEHGEDLIKSISASGKIPKNAWRLHAFATAALKNVKYRTVNLSKLDHGYLEFRTAGNAGYHRKLPQIQDDVGRFLTVLELACDPEAEKQEYIKKIVKLFNKGKEARIADDSDASQDPDAKSGSLDAIIGGITVDSLKRFGREDFDNELKATHLLFQSMKYAGARIEDAKVEVTVKAVAEFKLILSKITKKFPGIMNGVRALARNQIDLDKIKEFKKAFNIK